MSARDRVSGDLLRGRESERANNKRRRESRGEFAQPALRTREREAKRWQRETSAAAAGETARNREKGWLARSGKWEFKGSRSTAAVAAAVVTTTTTAAAAAAAAGAASRSGARLDGSSFRREEQPLACEDARIIQCCPAFVGTHTHTHTSACFPLRLPPLLALPLSPPFSRILFLLLLSLSRCL